MKPVRPVALSANEARYQEAVEELAPMVDLWQKILLVHTRTPEGYCRAQVCREGGTGRALVTFPCPIRVMAVSAQAVHRARTPTG